jgi:heme exporter protein D
VSDEQLPDQAEDRRLRTFKRTLFVIILLVLLIVLGRSIWLDNLHPLIEARDYRQLALTLAGILFILPGIALFIYGGLLFAVRSMLLMQDMGINQRNEILQNGTRQEVRQARRENTRALLAAWRPGFLWLCLGLVLISLGILLITS